MTFQSSLQPFFVGAIYILQYVGLQSIIENSSIRSRKKMIFLQFELNHETGVNLQIYRNKCFGRPGWNLIIRYKKTGLNRVR